jgi:2-polyprenyl-3-methyl-5-hydroxy-6-metoxy-1,4-benzoquinol methylase
MGKNCRVCSTPSSFLLDKDGFDLYECPNCRLVFVHPQPTPESLSKDLYSYESGYQSNRAVQDLSRDAEQKRVSLPFDYFEKVSPRGKMLDVGCGNGQMLYWAKRRGFSGAGVEVNKRTADWAVKNGFTVHNGFLENAPYEKHSFDVAFLGEIIEHVNDPRNFIRDAASFLRPGGHVAITTPNIDCAWSKTTFKMHEWFGIPWSSVTPPYHLFQFNPENLDRLMREEGFTLEKEWFLHIPPLRYELGMLHVLKRYKKSRKFSDLLFMAFAYATYVPLYAFFRAAHPFMKKDFQMVKVYRKQS